LYAITGHHHRAADSARHDLLLYFFTNWFQGLFSNVLFPILGFIFLPTTLLWYSAVQNWFQGEWESFPFAGSSSHSSSTFFRRANVARFEQAA